MLPQFTKKHCSSSRTLSTNVVGLAGGEDDGSSECDVRVQFAAAPLQLHDDVDENGERGLGLGVGSREIQSFKAQASAKSSSEVGYIYRCLKPTPICDPGEPQDQHQQISRSLSNLGSSSSFTSIDPGRRCHFQYAMPR